MRKNTTVKNNTLEFYRIVCTLLICTVHTKGVVTESDWFKNAYICVEFFFILSGYLLYNSFIQEEMHSTLGYVVKRFKRLWPEYAVAAIFEILAWGGIKGEFDLSTAVNELMMVQNTGLFRLSGYNMPCWYIPIMLFCGTMIYSMLTCWGEVLRKIIAPLVIVLGYTYIWGLDMGLNTWEYAGFISVPIIRGMCGMLIGLMIAILRERGFLTDMGKVLGTIIETLSLLLIVLGIMTDISSDMLTIVAFSSLIWITSCKIGILSTSVLTGNYWSKISEYSYSVYLNHMLVIRILYFVDGHIYSIDHRFLFPATFVFIIVYSVVIRNIIRKVLSYIGTKKCERRTNES